jgi:hypothetical protein
MNKKDEALKQALEALKSYKGFIEDAHILEGQWHWINGADKAIAAVEQALAAPVQEPVGHYAGDHKVRLYCDVPKGTHLYTSPPAAREWFASTRI